MALGIVGQTQDIPFTGLPNSSIFDPASESFVGAPSTAHGRWYPTVNEMGDGRMMTTSGLNDTDGGTNNTTEIWDGQSWGAEIPGQPNISDFPGFSFRYIRACTCFPPDTSSIQRLLPARWISIPALRPGRW